MSSEGRIKRFLLWATLLAVSSAYGCGSLSLRPTPQGMRLTITGAPDCILRIEVTVEQDNSPPQTIPISFQNGTGSGEFPRPIRPNENVRVTVRAVGIRQSPECETFSAEDIFVFSGRLQPDGERSYTVSYSDFVRVRQRSRPDTPTVPARIFLWANTTPRCTRICWQQWVNTRLFWRDQGGNWVEIANGRQFRDAFNNPQTFGQFGRDLTNPPDHCFRQDSIPNEGNATGIVDAPNQPINGTTAPQLLAAARASIQAQTGAPPPYPLVLQYRFNVRSVLWCDEPPPPQILGYYTWQATQEINFLSATQVMVTSYQIQTPAQWTTGTSGLDPAMLQH